MAGTAAVATATVKQKAKGKGPKRKMPPPPETTEGPEPTPSAIERGFNEGISITRVLMTVPVVVLVLSALSAFAYGTDVFVQAFREVVHHPLPVTDKVSYFLVIIDLFLIGATLLIAAIGLYELFVRGGQPRRPGSPLPQWLEMRDLNDLKARVVAMAVLLSATTFIEVLVDEAATGTYVLEVGGAVAVVIVALTLFLRYGERH
jgi:uncharacterized membrane protein YqhA